MVITSRTRNAVVDFSAQEFESLRLRQKIKLNFLVGFYFLFDNTDLTIAYLLTFYFFLKKVGKVRAMLCSL